MIIVWHRADLRTHDHPALAHAARDAGRRVVPTFVLDPQFLNPPYSGRNRVAFLHANLRALDEAYARLGSSLALRTGTPEAELVRLARDTAATAVYALQSLEPQGRERDARVKAALEREGIAFRLFQSDTVQQPGAVRSGAGTPFRVFTPFWRAWSALAIAEAAPAPERLEGHGAASHALPEPKAAIALPPAGEGAAFALLERFLREVGRDYERLRNLPAVEGTSRLSPHLHLGVLSPREAARQAIAAGHTGWARELAWRDFYRHLLWHEPRIASEPYRKEWQDFPFRDAPGDLEAWRTGHTGYPIVDAGMRQMQATGWMHNRVRMIVASFLTKHLLLPYGAGEAAFNETLVDGDLAANNGGWQWVTGCGVDAAPYFRVFNPVTQGETFDANADYIKRHVPELEALEPRHAHQPWTMTRPPKGYPAPIVDLKAGRDRFLETAKGHLKRE